MSYNGDMKTELKQQLRENPQLLKEEIAVLTRDLRHYQSRLRQLQQTALTPGETEAQRLAQERALDQQCLQLMRVRRSLRDLL